jgi:UDP-glucuronate 4-epimerase
MRHALVTGGAGFIGSHLVDRLMAEGWRVTVLDNFDPFYDPATKRQHLAEHIGHERFSLLECDIRDMDRLHSLPLDACDVIVHLAAKAGVRPSITDPLAYQAVNVQGTHNLLEFARHRGVRQFVFASSSSVYGVNPRTPWSEADAVLLPISPYAATKVSGELLGHVYSRLFGIRFLALRFFTVYGPRQRPDLAIHAFARRIMHDQPITVYGDGASRRDYTYIDDIVAGIRAAIAYDASDYEVINLGNNRTVSLAEMIDGLEAALGMQAVRAYLPPQPGDVPTTWANIDKAGRLLGYRPHTPFHEGIARFTAWLRADGCITLRTA